MSDEEETVTRAEEGRTLGQTETEKTSLVLLVEDNDIIRRVIVEELAGRYGYEVEAFAEAESALQRAREMPFDVVVMDISLPGMNGIEALKNLRSTDRYDQHPIIAITAYAASDDRERFLSEGFSEYLPKPFSGEELARTIQSLLE